MIAELKTLQSRVAREAVRAERELNAARANIVLAQAELQEERVKMGLVMTMVAKMVGQDVADSIVRDAENTAKAGGNREVAGDGMDRSVMTSDLFVAVQSYTSTESPLALHPGQARPHHRAGQSEKTSTPTIGPRNAPENPLSTNMIITAHPPHPRPYRSTTRSMPTCLPLAPLPSRRSATNAPVHANASGV